MQTTRLFGHFKSPLTSQHHSFLASQVNCLHLIFLLEIDLAGASPILEYQSSLDQCNPKTAKVIQTEKQEFSTEKTQATELIGKCEKYKCDPREASSVGNKSEWSSQAQKYFYSCFKTGEVFSSEKKNLLLANEWLSISHAHKSL